MKSRKASRASSIAAVLAAALTLVLPACGSANDGEQTTTDEAAASAKRGVALKRIGSFDSPVYVTGAPGFPKLLFVVEQPGRIVALQGGRSRTFLDLRGIVGYGGEEGLLSVAFPPDYARSKRFYVYYTDEAGDIRVDEFRRRSPTRASFGSRREVIRVPHPVNSNHNGGQLQFLGDLLYFATGDGGAGGDPPNNAQDKSVLLGKLLRIDPRASGGRPYSVPSSNPFVGKAGADEIYSYGLRNPFRFSFDTTHEQPRIAIGDVGQDEFEELDYLTVGRANGANFGWDAFEGFAKYGGGTPDPGGTVKPIFAYGRSRGASSCTIIGGYVANDPRLPSLRGRYVYADLCEGELRALVPHLKRASGDRKLGLRVESPSSFGEDQQGRLYVTSLEGPVFRLVPR
ncbi:MAG TPA: PQQ-dependent sugar dehydrogenase [Solirubrobacterales bacterium]|nr:PQQ-dependent sugar dehydrogenase [Solirubrobacterales bacterium]